MITARSLDFLEKNKKELMLSIEDLLNKLDRIMPFLLKLNSLNMKKSIESRNLDTPEKFKRESIYY
jgi:hypothetical protein